MPAELVEGLGEPAGGAGEGQRPRGARVARRHRGIASEAARADETIGLLVEGREVLVGDRPVRRETMLVALAEVGRPEARPDRAIDVGRAADPVPHQDLRGVRLDRIVVGMMALVDVGTPVRAPLPGPVGTVVRMISRLDPCRPARGRAHRARPAPEPWRRALRSRPRRRSAHRNPGSCSSFQAPGLRSVALEVEAADVDAAHVRCLRIAPAPMSRRVARQIEALHGIAFDVRAQLVRVTCENDRLGDEGVLVIGDIGRVPAPSRTGPARPPRNAARPRRAPLRRAGQADRPRPRSPSRASAARSCRAPPSAAAPDRP